MTFQNFSNLACNGIASSDRYMTLGSSNHEENSMRDSEISAQYCLPSLKQGLESVASSLARDLHDGFGQHLVGLLLGLKLLARHVSTDEGLQRINMLSRQIDDMTSDLRKVVKDLRRGEQETGSIASDLQALTVSWSESTGLRATFGITGHEAPMPPDTAGAVLNLAKEALTNIAKHAASPSKVTLRLGFELDGLSLTIDDDGAGFSWTGPRTLHSLAENGRFGLVGMHERTMGLGGCLRIETEPGRGVRLRATFPIELAVRPQ